MGRKINIGVLVGNVEDEFSHAICLGVWKAIDEIDANIIIIPGKYLDLDRSYDESRKFDYQNNT